jgi:dihydropteroate synthase
MQEAPTYDDLLSDIKAFLSDAVDRATSYGIRKSRIIIDPGIGFGKTFGHNFLILKNLADFQDLNTPIMVGSSRKAFIRHLLKCEDAEDLDAGHPMVEIGSQAAVSAAVLNGAHVVRVHDVANTKATVSVIDAIVNA